MIHILWSNNIAADALSSPPQITSCLRLYEIDSDYEETPDSESEDEMSDYYYF